jgi:hypothetical protein
MPHLKDDLEQQAPPKKKRKGSKRPVAQCRKGKKNSPWSLGPHCDTHNARAKWIW